MPNWVSVNIKFDTNEATATEIIKSLKNEAGEIDFNVLLPMPSALSVVRSPSKIVSQEEYDAQDLEAGSLSITAEMQKEFLSKYGSDNWYDWSSRNWGTKWNINEAEINSDSIHFQTAWSAPFPYIDAISSRFPNVKILYSWADEDIGQNLGYGESLAGETILIEEPDGSDEFCAGAAFQIQGGNIRWDDETAEATAKEYGYGQDDSDVE